MKSQPALAEKQERKFEICFARALACVFIVITHTLDTLESYGGKDMWRTWFSVGVPIFIIISGQLARKEDGQSVLCFAKKKCKRILVPYWLWLFIAFAMYWIGGAGISKSNFFTLLFMGQNSGSLNIFVLPGMGQLWFVPFILGCYCLVPVLHMIIQEIVCKSAVSFVLYGGGYASRHI